MKKKNIALKHGRPRGPEPVIKSAAFMQFRNTRGMSQQDLADRLRVSISYVSSIESGRRRLTAKVAERLEKLIKQVKEIHGATLPVKGRPPGSLNKKPSMTQKRRQALMEIKNDIAGEEYPF